MAGTKKETPFDEWIIDLIKIEPNAKILYNIIKKRKLNTNYPPPICYLSSIKQEEPMLKLNPVKTKRLKNDKSPKQNCQVSTNLTAADYKLFMDLVLKHKTNAAELLRAMIKQEIEESNGK